MGSGVKGGGNVDKGGGGGAPWSTSWRGTRAGAHEFVCCRAPVEDETVSWLWFTRSNGASGGGGASSIGLTG